MTDWCPDLSASNAPRYIAIADAIEADFRAGKLSPGDRLPAQRQLAGMLGLDFTTVARGYTEARRRGAISSLVGSGTFVTGTDTPPGGPIPVRAGDRLASPDFSMNLPPEPEAPELIGRMQEGLAAVSADIVSLLRYQTFDPAAPDRQAAASWLGSMGLTAQPEEVLFAAGSQAALASILTTIARPGERIACENITYPGIRSLCGLLQLELLGLPQDEDGVDPDAFRNACEAGRLRALYLNPTIQNPTTRTIPESRRKELARIARHQGVAILEDDPYGMLSRNAPPPFAALAPDVTWYVGSLSKCIGAGLRLAYVTAPDRSAGRQFERVQRTSSVMISPLTAALATRWIEDGTAKALLRHVRSESAARQALAARHLKDFAFRADPDGFHLWLELGNGWTRSAFVSQMRSQPIGLAESDPFTVGGPAGEAVRLCLGGPVDRARIESALAAIGETLATSPEKTSAYF